MNSFRLIALALAASFATFAPVQADKPEKDENQLGEITQTVARMLESEHFSRQRLNNEVEPGVTQARKALDFTTSSSPAFPGRRRFASTSEAEKIRPWGRHLDRRVRA